MDASNTLSTERGFALPRRERARSPVAVGGVVSVLMPDKEAAMLALENRTSRPVHVPQRLRHSVRPGSKVVALLDRLDVIDWTICG